MISLFLNVNNVFRLIGSKMRTIYSNIKGVICSNYCTVLQNAESILESIVENMEFPLSDLMKKISSLKIKLVKT